VCSVLGNINTFTGDSVAGDELVKIILVEIAQSEFEEVALSEFASDEVVEFLFNVETALLLSLQVSTDGHVSHCTKKEITIDTHSTSLGSLGAAACFATSVRRGST
jgi:hypothetical protein